MPVFNWIETRFAGGEDYVSDAPEDVAREIASVLSQAPSRRDGLDFGCKPLPSRSLSVVYLCWRAPGPAQGARFLHAIASEQIGAPEPRAIEALFRTRYGAEPEARIRELSRRLGGLPVQAAVPAITDLFIDRKELSMFRRAAAAEPQLGSPIRAGHIQIPWLIAALAIAAAGFLAGGRFEAEREPPAVSAPPPPPEIVERLAALERSQAEAHARDGEALEQERQRHAEALAGKEREIAALGERIAELERSAQEKPAPAALRLAEVRAATLRVRSGPGPKHKVVTELGRGDRVVTAARKQGGWVRVEAPVAGWVASDFLATIEPAAEAPQS